MLLQKKNIYEDSLFKNKEKEKIGSSEGESLEMGILGAQMYRWE